MTPPDDADALPRWNVTDVHESLGSRSFVAAMEQAEADVDRLVTEFDRHGIGDVEPRQPTAEDGVAADAVLDALNETMGQLLLQLDPYVYSSVSTDSRHDQAQALLSEIVNLEARAKPLHARLADWVQALGVDALGEVSERVAEHRGPLERLAARSDHQMSPAEEHLLAELETTGSSAWNRMRGDVTSQLTAAVEHPDGRIETLPIATVRGLAMHADPAVRKAAYDAELAASATVAVPVAAALNAIKGEANAVNRRRRWEAPIDASLFANSVSRPTFDAMQAAVLDSLDDFRGWMRAKARLHGHDGPLPWWDLFAPLPVAPGTVTWGEGVDLVKRAFAGYSPQLGSLVDRAIAERWIDAAPRDGKVGGAFCMPFIGGRSLVLLNWSGSVDSVQTTAHELGHAYHNTTLAERTYLQRRLPMALAETASIFCETLMVEHGLATLDGAERLALLDVDLQGAAQVVVDIQSRFLFETEVFARRQRRTLGVNELNEIMLASQSDAYGDGLDQQTAHPYMWLLKPHYYSSHFYNWPYTYGLLFGLGLYSCYQDDPERFRSGYDNLLSRAGMDTAEELGQAFGLDVTDTTFWTASLDVLRHRVADYDTLADQVVTNER